MDEQARRLNELRDMHSDNAKARTPAQLGEKERLDMGGGRLEDLIADGDNMLDAAARILRQINSPTEAARREMARHGLKPLHDVSQLETAGISPDAVRSLPQFIKDKP